MRWLLAVTCGLLPLVLPLPGGGSGRLRVRPPSAGFRTTVTMLEEGLVTPAEGLAFPRFLKRKAVGFSPQVELPPPAASVNAHEILLTFDDGPDLQTTPLVLQELDRRGLKGVFFVNGKSLLGDRPSDYARRHLLRKLATHGHLVGNHSLSHKKLCLNQASIAEEIDGNAEIIAAATGVHPRLFRSPYGGTCKALEAALAQRGLTNVGWNIDPQEWRGDDADTTVPIVLAQLERLSGRGILLLHDTHRSTARALPRILDWIEAHNLRVAKRLTTPQQALDAYGVTPTARPFRIVDYTVLLPQRKLPETGLERALASTVDALSILPLPQPFWR